MRPSSVPLISFLMLVSGFYLPMSVKFYEIKCMGQFSYRHIKQICIMLLEKATTLDQLSRLRKNF